MSVVSAVIRLWLEFKRLGKIIFDGNHILIKNNSRKQHNLKLNKYESMTTYFQHYFLLLFSIIPLKQKINDDI